MVTPMLIESMSVQYEDSFRRVRSRLPCTAKTEHWRVRHCGGSYQPPLCAITLQEAGCKLEDMTRAPSCL